MGMKMLLIILLTLLTYAGFAQVNEKTFEEKFIRYSSSWNNPLLAMVLNQDKYSPGDTVWFRLFYFFEDMSPVTGQQLLDINLVDSKSKSLVHFLLKVNEGSGYSQIVIPPNVQPGFYHITAYSSFHLNFGIENIFRKEIQVVEEKQLKPNADPSLKIVSEGGHLVAGVPNLVVLYSKLNEAKILVSDDKGNEVLWATTNKNGFASIIFTPSNNRSYFAVIHGVKKSFPFPAVENVGFALKLSPAISDDFIRLKLEVSAHSDLLMKELYLVFTCSSKIKIIPVIRTSENNLVMTIRSLDLPHGLIHLSVLDNQGNVYASRDFFNGYHSSVGADLSLSDTNFRPRTKIRVDVNISDQEGRPLKGDFTVSINQDSIHKSKDDDSFLISLFTRGLVLKSLDSVSLYEDLDRLLVIRSMEIPWKKIVEDKFLEPPYRHKDVQVLTGTVYAGTPAIPVPDNTKVQFYLQKARFHYETFTIAGKVKFTLPAFSGRDEIFTVAESSQGKPLPGFYIVWDTLSVKLPPATSSNEIADIDSYAAFTRKKRVVDSSFEYFVIQKDRPEIITSHQGNFEKAIGGADVVIRTKDYVVFSSVEELIKEVIPTLYYRKQGGVSKVGIRLNQPMEPDGNPVYLIDEVATQSTDFFLSLKPADIVTIKIIKDPAKLIPFGILGKNGFVIVETKRGDSREPLSSSSLVIDGQNARRDFYLQDFSSHLYSVLPYFRSAVYWNPFIRITENGKASFEFYSTDDTGPLRIKIKGLTSTGIPFFKEEIININLTGN